MNIQSIQNLCEKYKIKTEEIACIILYMQFQNMTFAFTETLAKGKSYRHLKKAAALFFSRDDVKKFIDEQRNNFFCADGIMIDSEEEEEPVIKKRNKEEDNKPLLEPGFELTKDNIKQVLEFELSKTTDPEKRTALLIRVADFLSLNDSGTIDFEKPVIYLPDRMA